MYFDVDILENFDCETLAETLRASGYIAEKCENAEDALALIAKLVSRFNLSGSFSLGGGQNRE